MFNNLSRIEIKLNVFMRWTEGSVTPYCFQMSGRVVIPVTSTILYQVIGSQVWRHNSNRNISYSTVRAQSLTANKNKSPSNTFYVGFNALV